MLRKVTLDTDVSISDNRLKYKILSCLYLDSPGILAFGGPHWLDNTDLATADIYSNWHLLQQLTYDVHLLLHLLLIGSRIYIKSAGFMWVSVNTSISFCWLPRICNCIKAWSTLHSNWWSQPLDLLDRKSYSSATLNFRNANYQTIICGYQLILWENLS